MKSLRSTLVGAILAMFLGVGLLLPFTARASEAGRRNTTIGLGVVTGYFAAKKQWVPAAIAGVGTYAAYHNWQAQINARHRHRAHLAYLSRHRRYLSSLHRKSHHRRY